MAKDVKARLSWDGVKKFTSEVAGAGEAVKSAFEAGKQKVREFETQGQNAATKLKASFSSLSAVLGPLGIGVGIGAAVFGLKKIVMETINGRDEIAKMGRALGISVEFLSEMGFAAEQSGADLDTLNIGMRGLIRNMKGAKDGLLESQRSFKQLGVNVTDSNGNLRKAEDVFLEVADKISKMKNETEAAALAQEIFGRAGLKLVPLLKEGKAGILDFREEAKRFGITITEEMAKKAEDANDAIGRFTMSSKALAQNLVTLLLPSITNMADGLASLTSKLNALIQLRDKIAAFLGGEKLLEFEKEFEAKNKLVEEQTAAIKEYNRALREKAEAEAKLIPKPGAPPLPEVLEPELEPELPTLETIDDELEQINQRIEQGKKLVDEKKDALDGVKDRMRQIKEHAQALGQFWGDIGAQIGAAVFEGERFVKTLERIAKQLAKRVFAGLIGGGLAFIFSGGNPLAAQAGFKFASGFAAGGRPAPGEPAVVGERGPEVFVPDRPGTVIPNDVLSGLKRPEINVTQHITMRRIDMAEMKTTFIPLLRRALIEMYGVSVV